MAVNIFFLIVYLLGGLLLIRWHISFYGLYAFNPLARRIYELTQPLLLPFRFLQRGRWDWPTLLVAFLLFFGSNLIIALGSDINIQGSASPVGIILAALIMGSVMLLNCWLDLTFYSLVIAVVASWLQPSPHQPVLQIALALHHWLVAPIRRLLPTKMGMFDLAPLIAVLCLQLFRWLLASLLS